MPTEYTAKIYNNEPQTFEEFVMDFSRAFGALIELRDSPTAPIPKEFIPDPYYKNQLEKTKLEIEMLSRMSIEEAEQNAYIEYEKASSSFLISTRETAEKRHRYEVVLEKIQAWVPPSKDHTKLKEFMADQITESMKFDCNDLPAPTRKTGRQWLDARKQGAARDLDYFTEQHEKSVNAARDRTRWVQQLIASVKGVR